MVKTKAAEFGLFRLAQAVTKKLKKTDYIYQYLINKNGPTKKSRKKE